MKNTNVLYLLDRLETLKRFRVELNEIAKRVDQINEDFKELVEYYHREQEVNRLEVESKKDWLTG